MILLPFLAYFGGHSYLHWKGEGGSGGSMRVMASIIPLSALLAMKGLSVIYEFIKKRNPILVYAVVLIVMYFVVITPKKVYQIPVPDFKDMTILRQATDWYIDSEYYGSFLIYGDRRMTSLLDMDPYDREQGRCYLHDSKKPEKYIPNGAVAVWDAHFSTNFNNIGLDVMMNSKYYKLIRVFEPEVPFKVRGGYDYAIYFFQKHSGEEPVNNYEIREQLREEKKKSYRLIEILDFENGTVFEKHLTETAYSGHYAYQMNNDDEFSPTIILSGKDIKQMDTFPYKVKVTTKVKVDSASAGEGIVIVSSFEHRKKPYGYFTSGNLLPDTVTGWYALELEYELPRIRAKRDVIKFYVWNKEKEEFVLDDINVSMCN